MSYMWHSAHPGTWCTVNCSVRKAFSNRPLGILHAKTICLTSKEWPELAFAEPKVGIQVLYLPEGAAG